MLVTRLFFLTILVFYLSNSSYPIISQNLLSAKWGLVLILLIFLYSKKVEKYSIEYILPNSVYFVLGLLLLHAATVTYMNSHGGNGISKLIGFAVILLIASKLSVHFMRKENRNYYYKILLFISILVVYSAIIFYFLGLNLGRVGEGGVRFSGWVDNANTLALMFIPLYPAILLASIRNKRLSFASPRVILLLMIFIMILTGTRSVAIGVCIATLVIFLSQRGSTEKAILLFTLSLFIVYLFGLEIQDFTSHFKSFQRNDDLLLSGRDEVWGLAIYLIQQSPYFGFGFDTEAILIEKHASVLENHQGATFHNSYLSYLVHLGFIGAIPIIWIGAVSIASFFNIRKYSDDQQVVDIKHISAAVVLSSFVHAIFETWLFSPGNLAMLLFWLALFNLISVKHDYTADR